MRDIKRIRKFCSRLAAAWEQVPDWRFGQLMYNVFGSMGKDPFFPEDDEMIEFIEQYLGVGNNREPKKEGHDGNQNQVSQ